MKSANATVHGAISIVNAIASGKGSALGISLKVSAKVEFIDGSGITFQPSGEFRDDKLIRAVVTMAVPKQMLEQYHVRVNVNCELVSLDHVAKYTLDAHLIVNATPIGMKGEDSLITAEHISSDSVVYDLVYRPMETRLIQSAEEAGATVIYGYEMLLEQGARSFEIWTQMEAPRDVMKKMLVGDFV